MLGIKTKINNAKLSNLFELIYTKYAMEMMKVYIEGHVQSRAQKTMEPKKAFYAKYSAAETERW